MKKRTQAPISKALFLTANASAAAAKATAAADAELHAAPSTDSEAHPTAPIAVLPTLVAPPVAPAPSPVPVPVPTLPASLAPVIVTPVPPPAAVAPVPAIPDPLMSLLRTKKRLAPSVSLDDETVECMDRINDYLRTFNIRPLDNSVLLKMCVRSVAAEGLTCNLVTYLAEIRAEDGRRKLKRSGK